MTDAEANDDFRGSQLFHWFAESIKTRLQVAGNVERSSRWFVDASAAYPGRLDPQHAHTAIDSQRTRRLRTG